MIKTAKLKKFENPDPGLHRAVLVDLIRGRSLDAYHPGQWKYNFKLVFQLETRNSANKPFYASDICSDTMFEQSNLRKYFESWGIEFKQSEVEEGVDLEAYIGRSANVMVILKESGGRLFANISGIFPLSKNEKPVKADTYIRRCHREGFVPVPDPEEEEDSAAPAALPATKADHRDGISLADMVKNPDFQPPPEATAGEFTATNEDVSF